MKVLKIVTSFMLLLLITLASVSTAQQNYSMAPGEKIPFDKAVTIGKLPNGLTYYIRVNHKPEKRAEMRLVVKAGSLQEDDDQLGLAHFC